MARMIPPRYAPSTPRGEKDLFNKLEKDPSTENWVVFHSLDIKKHKSKIESELDMVILVPDHGILCVEVKGCDVKRVNGEWVYSYGTSLEGPFKQASKAMHSLRDYIKSKDSSLYKLLYFSCAIFTSIDFNEDSPEWHQWQYINYRLFLKNPISVNVINILSRAHQHIADKSGNSSWYSPEYSRPTTGQIAKITSILRDDFEYSISPRRNFEQSEERILHFTEEQYDALDLLLDNERVLFKGPAGTGKTFIALEQARRAKLHGHSVLLVCYNKLLGEWLKFQTSNFEETANIFTCQTFHSLLLEISKERPKQEVGSDYWQNVLPNKAIERLLGNDSVWPQYDFIIVDEAQDLIRDEYLDLFDLLLNGGLAGGKWAFFGDFERQAIYLPDLEYGASKALQKLKVRATDYTTFSLRINCRNAEPIAQTLTLTSGLTPGYKSVLHDIENSEVDPYFYSTNSEQNTLLNDAIIDAEKTYKPSEIVILSMREDINSCAGNFSEASAKLTPIRNVKNANKIPYASIHAFKGLEAAAVIITDIESLEDERTQSLLYIAMSRARIRLYMLMHERCRLKYEQLLDIGFARTVGK